MYKVLFHHFVCIIHIMDNVHLTLFKSFKITFHNQTIGITRETTSILNEFLKHGLETTQNCSY